MPKTDHHEPVPSIGPDTALAIRTGEMAATGLRRCVVVAALLLLILTRRLWWPLTDFPQVSLVAWSGRLPLWSDWAGYAAMLAGLLAAFCGGPSARVWRCGLIAYSMAFVVMVLINQHRLQPWAYQFALIALSLVLVPGPQAAGLVRVLTVGIYFHSALSKLDFSFLDSQGPYLLSGLTNIVGISVASWTPTVRRCAAALLPASELLVAFGLYFHCTRLAALVASVLMHAALITALGPWSLDHKAPVLIWNGYFIAQNVLLFGFGRKTASLRVLFWPDNAFERRLSSAKIRPWLARAVVWLAILLPFLLPFELFDVWPSWAVYASRPARARVLIDQSAVANLPPALRPYVIMEHDADVPCVLRTDRWSLDATNAPIYPQPRFQLGMALALAGRPELGDRIHVDFQSTANRWTGERTTRRVSGNHDLRMEAEIFYMNAVPRSTAER